jgi:hypothetical protein
MLFIIRLLTKHVFSNIKKISTMYCIVPKYLYIFVMEITMH